MTDTLLIVAGDCGFGFEKPGYYEQIFNKISRRLTKTNNWVVMIRGNHDDPTYFIIVFTMRIYINFDKLD